MQNTRVKVRQRRLAFLFGTVIFLTLGALAFTDRSEKNYEYHSIFFDNADRWPSYVKSFLPLDLALMWIFGYAVMYIAVVGLSAQDGQGKYSQSSPMYWLWWAAAAGGGFGAMTALVIVGRYGWYKGLESFVLGAAFGVAIFAVLSAIGLAVGWFFEVAAPVIASKWRRSRVGPVIQPLVDRTGYYLDAKDIPDPPDDAA